MGVTIRIKNDVTFDAEAAADIIVAAVIGDIINRMEDGIGLNDEKMRPYSPGYRKRLERMGEDTKVDHRVTGLMLSQIMETARVVEERDKDGIATRVTMTFGVGGGGNRNNIAAFLQTLRPWFGMSPQGEIRVAEALAGSRPPDRSTTRRREFPARAKGASRFTGAGQKP